MLSCFTCFIQVAPRPGVLVASPGHLAAWQYVATAIPLSIPYTGGFSYVQSAGRRFETPPERAEQGRRALRSGASA